MTGGRERRPPRRSDVTRLDTQARAALRAWADLDRFELPEVPLSTDGGWAAVGEIRRGEKPTNWPPRPDETPKSGHAVLVTRVMFGCLPVADLEEMLDEAFPDDQRFVQTGVRRPGRRQGAPVGARTPMTCRGSFLVDDAGRPVADSLSYSPLIDFARHVRHELGRNPDRQRAVATALRTIDERDGKMRSAWEGVADGPDDRDPVALVVRLLLAVSVQVDIFRYVTQWVPIGQEPTGQLPAFFRDDLLAAADSPTSPLVHAYLAGRPQGHPAGARDVGDHGHFTGLVRPSRMPRAAWPSEHLPRLSQQVALSAVLGPDADALMAVNGPPGTGKTTLLRDVYANVVTDRAQVMVGYDDPRTAFAPRRAVPSRSSRTWELYAPRAPLCGFEMLVASSNNAAVQNVSQELPALSEVRRDLAHPVTYFRAATEAEQLEPVIRPEGGEGVARKPPATRPGLLPEGKPAWGMAAAVLGSRGRVSAFAEVVGRYRKGPGRTDLLAQLAAGATPIQWAAARRRFREVRDAVAERVAALDRVAADIDSVDRLADAAQAAQRATEDAQWALDRCRAVTERAQQAADDSEASAAAATLALEQVLEQRPSALSRLFRTDASVSWTERSTAAQEAADTAARQLAARRDVLAHRLADEQAVQAAVRAAAGVRRETQARLQELRAAIDACPQRLDAEWWAKPREVRELTPVWMDEELQRQRAELFAAAMHVHEVFARRAGAQMAANLRTWMALQTNEVETTVGRQVALAAWQAFFLLVPLASTTFASMARMLQDVPTGSLGWLIVDEAGQAVPAAAVGGLARFRRAVVVGDPQQLEPVVTLPAALVAELMRHHRAPAELAPNRASVQTLTDSVSRFGTERRGEWIGLPLLVHNRCLNPMFTVANDIAYDGAMIHGRQGSDGAHPLEPSRWFDVPRPDGAHFRDEDAEQVLALLRQLDWAQLQPIAIISPFKEVVRGLSRRVEREVLGLLPPERLQDRKEREKALEAVKVGTVHTFQGREKDAVILVLGGGSHGARQWAAGNPNLFNVAVTRAKDRLYVVGDRSRWKDVGYARVLDAQLSS